MLIWNNSYIPKRHISKPDSEHNVIKKIQLFGFASVKKRKSLCFAVSKNDVLQVFLATQLSLFLLHFEVGRVLLVTFNLTFYRN